MASTIKVDKIEGSTGSTVTVPTGQTFTVTDGIPVARWRNRINFSFTSRRCSYMQQVQQL